MDFEWWFFWAVTVFFFIGTVIDAARWSAFPIGKQKRRARKATLMAERNSRLLETALDNHRVAMKERRYRHQQAIKAFDEQLGIKTPRAQDLLLADLEKQYPIHAPVYLGGGKYTACGRKYNPDKVRISSVRRELTCSACIHMHDMGYCK